VGVLIKILVSILVKKNDKANYGKKLGVTNDRSMHLMKFLLQAFLEIICTIQHESGMLLYCWLYFKIAVQSSWL
jgi:hypothetical protein